MWQIVFAVFKRLKYKFKKTIKTIFTSLILFHSYRIHKIFNFVKHLFLLSIGYIYVIQIHFWPTVLLFYLKIWSKIKLKLNLKKLEWSKGNEVVGGLFWIGFWNWKIIYAKSCILDEMLNCTQFLVIFIDTN